MASNKINLNAKQDLLKGINILYEAVSSTLGPRSHEVAIDYGFEQKTLKDGVSVARVIMLEDKDQNMGASLVMEAAKKQVKEVGDGTTAVIILANSIITEAEKLVTAGVKPMELRDGLTSGVETLVKEIQKMARPIKTYEEKVQVATISAEEEELGKLVADTLEKVGEQGLITVEESKSPDTFFEHQEGMQFDKGYASPYFITNPETMEATLLDTRVLVTDIKLNPQDLLPVFKELFEKRAEALTIVGPDPTDAMRDFLVVNKLQGKIRALYVKAPQFGDRQNAMLQDIAILTGARFISGEKGDKVEDIKIEDLGTAGRITAFTSQTEIVGGRGKKADIKSRCEAIKKLIQDEESDFERDKLKERYAKLTGGVGVIKVGGQTEAEMKERKERADDAVHALRAALVDGIVPGGETIYGWAMGSLKGDTYANTILKNAVLKPLTVLMTNSGYDPGYVTAKLESTSFGEGYDVTDGKMKNLFEAGIIDPAKVPIQALRNAVSVAIRIINTGISITPNPEENKK